MDEKRIEVYRGFIIIRDGKVYDYEGGETDEGIVFKDYDAFRKGEGVCYIPEMELEAIHEALADLEDRYENITDPDDEDYVGDAEYWEDRASILADCGITREDIIQGVLDSYGEDFLLTREQAECIAADLFEEMDWACLATYITDDLFMEDEILYRGEELFTELQVEAVKEGKTPREYRKEA